MTEHMREPQYDVLLRHRDRHGFPRLGLMTGEMWDKDPKRLLFHLARYKFVAKMLAGKGRVLEVGCGDGFGSRIVAQAVESLVVTDFDPLFITDVHARARGPWFYHAAGHDMLAGAAPAYPFDAAYALDVLEHIDPADEDRFLANICASLGPHGCVILGAPTPAAQPYGNDQSRAGHVNVKDAEPLRAFVERQFHNVLIFSMNDEVVHTGFYPLAHYLFALGFDKRESDL